MSDWRIMDLSKDLPDEIFSDEQITVPASPTSCTTATGAQEDVQIDGKTRNSDAVEEKTLIDNDPKIDENKNAAVLEGQSIIQPEEVDTSCSIEQAAVAEQTIPDVEEHKEFAIFPEQTPLFHIADDHTLIERQEIQMEITGEVQEGPEPHKEPINEEAVVQSTETSQSVLEDLPVATLEVKDQLDLQMEVGEGTNVQQSTTPSMALLVEKPNEIEKDQLNRPDAQMEVGETKAPEDEVIIPIADTGENGIITIPEEILDVSKTEAVLTSSLALIADYGISSGSDSDSEESSEESSSSSSSSSSSDEDEVKVVDIVSYRNTVNVLSSGESDGEVEFVEGSEVAGKKRPPKIIAKGEFSVTDLPPIEDLNISVPEHECLELGKIMSAVDQLVLVESNPGSIALDLDTVLFLDNGRRALGRIFDVLGQVNQPIYCVRFNSAEQIQEKEIVAGMKVYYNNQREEHTTVVVLANLLRYKGTDASWEHDIEPPEGCLEFSDDEAERGARRAKKAGHKSVPEDPSKQRMKRVRQPPPNNRQQNQGRVRNPYSGPRYPNPPPQWNANQMNPSGQWPTSQPGYGNDYSNHSWHTYYQQQPQPFPPQQFMHPPPSIPQGPFYMNPYAQPGPGVNMPNIAAQQQQWHNYYGNGAAGGPGPSQGGGQFKQERN